MLRATKKTLPPSFFNIGRTALRGGELRKTMKYELKLFSLHHVMLLYLAGKARSIATK
jgi:hypothetical protein